MKSKKELENKNIRFKLITLDRPVHSVEDVRKVCSCKKAEVIKTLLFVGKQLVMAIVPGNKRVNLIKLKEVVSDLTLHMAKYDDVKKITGYNIGSVTPFGVCSNVIQIADSLILNLPKFILCSGDDDVLIEMEIKEFKKSFDGSFKSIVD